MSDTNADEQIKEYALAERKFLHDISNHLVVAQGMGSFLKKALGKNENVGEKEKERMEKVYNAVLKISECVKERRAILHAASKDEE